MAAPPAPEATALDEKSLYGDLGNISAESNRIALEASVKDLRGKVSEQAEELDVLRQKVRRWTGAPLRRSEQAALALPLTLGRSAGSPHPALPVARCKRTREGAPRSRPTS